jgi:DNA-binding LacI/PurR family transcriptional regulator
MNSVASANDVMSRRRRRSSRDSNGRVPARRGRPIRYRVVTDALREKMARGELPAGVKLPTLRELAAKFKVSINTVRNAIRVLESEGGLYHVQDVGTFVRPSSPAPSQLTLALIAVDIGCSFEMQIARSVERACQERGWGLQILDTQGEEPREGLNLKRLGESGARGAIVMPMGGHANLEAIVRLKLGGLPIVLIDRGLPGLRVDRVEADHEASAYLASHYLLGKGHRHIQLLTVSPATTSVVDRICGFERALHEAGLEGGVRMRLQIDSTRKAEGHQPAQRWLGAFEAVMPVLRSEQRGAFVAESEYAAWGVYEACRELGLHVPQDVSIIALGDSELARAMSPPLTGVEQRPDEIGRRAVEFLEERVMRPRVEIEPRHIRVPVELIERGSVACPQPGR